MDEAIVRTMHKATAQDKFNISLLLRDHTREAPGGVVYEDGWSDDVIADQLGVSVHSVSYMRKAALGPLVVEAPPAPTFVSQEAHAELRECHNEMAVTLMAAGVIDRVTCQRLLAGGAMLNQPDPTDTPLLNGGA